MRKNIFTTLAVFLVVITSAYAGSWSGHVVDSSSNDIENATVVALLLGTAINTSLTDSLGNFNVSGLTDGSYTLRFMKSGYTQKEIIMAPAINNSNENRTDLTWPFDVVLVQALPGRISGYVFGPTGPLSNVAVGIQGGSDITDATGAYSISTIDGTYDVQALLTGYITSKVTNVLVQPNTTTEINFTLTRNTTYVPPSTPPSSGGGGGGSGGSYTIEEPAPLVVDVSYLWDITANPRVFNLKEGDSVRFVYDKTTYTVTVEKLTDEMAELSITPADETRAGFKGDVFDFNVKDSGLDVVLKDISKDLLFDSSGTSYSLINVASLEFYFKETEQTCVSTSAENGVINIAGEVVPPKESIPVGIGISFATVAVGLLLFAGIRKISA